MKIVTILKGGIKERHNIRSGRIHKKGFDPKDAKYGVIYSSNPDNKEDNDLGLDSADFKGAWIGPMSTPESDKNQFFTILGAYYYQDNHPDKPKTTKVFGIAESEFGVTEGGSTDLDHAGWMLDDPEKKSLDEAYWTKEGYGKHHGWTFIVDLKDRDQYPKSEQELKIFKEEKVECPEVDSKLTSEKIKKDDKTETHKFTADVTGQEMPEKYEWDCGDGTSENTTEPTMTHEYPIPESEEKGYTITMNAVGPGDCTGSANKVIIISPEPVVCPKITSLMCVESKKDAETSAYTFTVTVSGEQKPEKYEWDFGDGHKDTTTETTTSHNYKMPAAGATATHKVKVTALGPKDCSDSEDKPVILTTPLPPPPPCPPICNYLQLIVAFFMALTFCTILVACVANLERHSQHQMPAWLVPMIFVFGVLALACIFFWFKKGCPIGKKQWMGIFSIVFLTIFLVGLSILGCVSWVIIILALTLAGFCFYMYKKCGATVKELILAGVVCFLAFCVAGLWIASKVLDCG